MYTTSSAIALARLRQWNCQMIKICGVSQMLVECLNLTREGSLSRITFLGRDLSAEPKNLEKFLHVLMERHWLTISIEKTWEQLFMFQTVSKHGTCAQKWLIIHEEKRDHSGSINNSRVSIKFLNSLAIQMARSQQLVLSAGLKP